MNTIQVGSGQISAPLNEELAGPVTAAPVRLRDRISSIDVLRGAALLGILVLNIDSFGNPELVHDIPIGTPIDNFSGPHAHLNLALLFIKWMFFEAKMRGIFSMLFGAGVILMTSRAERRGAGQEIADIYTRRNMLLTLFGFLHGCLIWGGDILFDYGLTALLFLYPCRKLKAKTLLWTGTFLSLFVATVGGFLFLGAMHDLTLSRQAAIITAQEKKGLPITPQQQEALQQWKARVDSQQLTPAVMQAAVDEGKLGYFASILDRAQGLYQDGFTRIHVDLIADNLSAMLIGMGLMKIGFFTAELSYATYLWTALIGFGISLPLYAEGIYRVYASGFYFLEWEKWLFAPYYLTREPGMIAIAAVILLLIKSGTLKTPQRWLAAVGRTALSNYLLTSILCQTIFVWGPWKLFGKLEYYQLMYVVLGVWAVNLVLSSLWLRSFAFGPVEWLWRSLTYAKLQPMRLKQPLAHPAGIRVSEGQA